MIVKLVNSPDFRDMMQAHLKDMIAFLLDEGLAFGLLCNIEHVDFDPPLPSELYEQLPSVTLFMIAGYTFESFELSERKIYFEAGFGPQNFGSVVSMPILAVLQVIVEETPLLINMALPQETEEIQKEKPGEKSSMEAFLSNPENRKFIKKS